MSGTVGFLYRLEWNNPYTNPPGGLPRVMAEIYLRSENGEGARIPQVLMDLHKPGCGFCVSVRAISPPGKGLGPETLASVRRKRLRRRLEKKYPLFADQMFDEAINERPAYFLEGKSEHDEGKRRVLQHYMEEYERLKGIEGDLIVYGSVSEIASSQAPRNDNKGRLL